MRFITIWMGDFDATQSYLQDSSLIAPWEKTDLSEVNILSAQGHFDAVCGRLEDARQKLEAALNIACEKPDYAVTCFLLNQLGNVLVHQRKLKEGLILLEQSLSMENHHPPLFWSLDILTDYAGAVYKNKDVMLAQHLFRQSLNAVHHTLPKVPRHLEGLAQVAQALGNCDRAARLLGAAHYLRERMSLPILPIDREDYDRLLASLRGEMSEQDFLHSWEAGITMPVEDGIAYAQAEV